MTNTTHEFKNLLLMSCCAPCSVGIISALHRDNKNFTVMFYNPNIWPNDEYQKRLIENKNLCTKLNVPFIDLDWDFDNWNAQMIGHENDSERGPRCTKCFNYRIARGIEYAKQNNFDAITTTFGVSRHKDQSQVDQCAIELCQKNEIKYIELDWKSLEPLRSKLNYQHDFYRQRYCGCPYSVKK